MTPVGLWQDEDGDLHEIRRRPHGYVVLCTTPEGDAFEVRDVRWRADRLKWTLIIPDGLGDADLHRSYETVRIELHRLTVRWKSSAGEGEETFTRVSA
ncbi:MAG: hypothetical protein KC549_12230 [Myxococcales bacterium]|nr:hypothetical protein [Myxococcales bacterium]MCB9547475.1 hypothetical protein [Myxococcales bacterium]